MIAVEQRKFQSIPVGAYILNHLLLHTPFEIIEKNERRWTE
ncbi:hypothetical protein B4100_1071 [Heyndrickxia coagulans]|nr:hypothetical protein B4100_1071 [Heyndrickxia coagulans]